MKFNPAPMILTDTLNTLSIVLIIVGCSLLFVSSIVLTIAAIKKKKHSETFDGGVWLLALGGKENIKEVYAVGSRLNINLEDKEIIDREKLKELGVSSVLVMSNKITLVIEGQAEKIAASLRQVL